MRVLIAFECSGIVRDAFAALGHDAWSCDLKPSENGGNHLKCDFREALKQEWDFIGFHNDCRVMANSGARWLYKDEIVYANVLHRQMACVKRVKNESRWQELESAAEMLKISLNDPRPGYVENSIMHCHAKKLIGRQQDQTIQPWQFGEPFFKGTCLWLRGGIASLAPTNILQVPAKGTAEHKAWSMVHQCAPGPDRASKRARTFPGIARAMAQQWGNLEI